ncbi:hypothetical protein [Acidiphilium acidophilum]|uniref:Uncharacterized protein n=1 Tax=Acidiphilium acidophilum TaxID=76588 RepID=A0AAW9DU84_ACIAO|nr:hypothetical protein [Acidiphilium acidophilum]MDX5932649.1 hypothetical protein [Acidiphilium acidophilum]
MTETPTISLTDRFAAIIRGLRNDVCVRGFQTGLNHLLLALISTRLTRIIERFAAIVSRDRATPAQPAETPARKPRPTPGREPPPGPAPLRLPYHFAWLLRLVPPTITQGNAAVNGRIGIQSLLDDPELLALIARNRAAGRLFRPLCHMLGIQTPPLLRRPKRPRAPDPTPPDPTPPAEPPRRRQPRAAPRPSPFPSKPRTPPAWDQHLAFHQILATRDFQF